MSRWEVFLQSVDMTNDDLFMKITGAVLNINKTMQSLLRHSSTHLRQPDLLHVAPIVCKNSKYLSRFAFFPCFLCHLSVLKSRYVTTKISCVRTEIIVIEYAVHSML